MAFITTGDHFCAECGDHKVLFAMEQKLRCPNVNCKTNKVDWQQPMEPGPVKWDQAMMDSRILGWRAIDTLPNDRTTIIGTYITIGAGVQLWFMRQRAPDSLDVTVRGYPATHWHEDSLGTP